MINYYFAIYLVAPTEVRCEFLKSSFFVVTHMGVDLLDQKFE